MSVLTRTILGSELWKIVGVPVADPRVLNGSDHAIGFTIEEMSMLTYLVSQWAINTTGVNEWWKTGSYGYQALPASFQPNIVQNRNVWSYPATHDAGRWMWPDWSGGLTDFPSGTTWTGIDPMDGPCPWGDTPYFDAQEKYPIAGATGFYGAGGPDSPTRIIIDPTLTYFDGTYYYPKCSVEAASGTGSFIIDIATNPANFDGPGAPVSCGTLTILGKSCAIYSNAAVPPTVNIEWVIQNTWT